MAHFAELDGDNNVLRVVVIANKDTADANGVEKEHIGAAFCERLFGGRWVQTSYNNNFRKRFAGIGFKYDASLDAFVPPKPVSQPSFVLDPQTANWIPPVTRPQSVVCSWDETLQEWVTVPQPYPSWTASGDPLRWVPPIDCPTDGKFYKWDEPTLSWIEFTP